MTTFRPGDRVYVTDPALAELRAIMARYGEDAPPNHHGTVDDVVGDEVWVEFDDGQVSLYPVAEVRHLRDTSEVEERFWKRVGEHARASQAEAE